MLQRVIGALRFLRYGERNAAGEVIQKAFQDGHFYSPIVDTAEAGRDQASIWPDSPQAIDIDFNEAEQRRWLTEILPKHLPDYDYSDKPISHADLYSFYTCNTQFSWLDARMLFTVMREIRPKRMIEIGSGFSSLLAADVNCRFLEGSMTFTCIEPYPRDFLRAGVPGISSLIERRVQDVPLEVFDALEDGDILFIDSSHVSKTGSDVNHIYFKILPRLSAGVLIHVHDIFLPCDYPKSWVLEHGFSWNEQYLVQALLMNSDGLEVLFGCAYAQYCLPDLLREALGGELYGGGSLWLRKKHHFREAA